MKIQMEMRKMIGNGYLEEWYESIPHQVKKGKSSFATGEVHTFGGKQAPWRLRMFFPETIISQG